MSTLHFDAVVVDCHNDLPVMLVEHYRQHDRPDHFAEWAIPELRTGGVGGQVLPVYVEPRMAEATLRQALLHIEHIHRDIEANADEVALCLTGAEIDAAVAAGKIACVLAMEGGAAIGYDVELFGLLYPLGVR